MRIGSIASGMGMHLHGLKQASGVPIWAIECDSAIAQVYSKNHQGQLHIKKVQDVNPQELADIDLLTITLSCKNASLCKGSNALETADDMQGAIASSNIIAKKLPKVILIENVWRYRQFESFLKLQDALSKNGYYFQTYKFNAADWGVAQSRSRLYCIAVRGGAFWNIAPPSILRVGWYEAISDLIQFEPDCKLANWQIARYPDILSHDNILIKRVGGGRESDRVYYAWEPSFTIKALGRGSDNHWHQADFVSGGKVKAISSRVALRLFGDKETADSIWLPSSKALASEVVGNGASWIVFKYLIESLNIF